MPSPDQPSAKLVARRSAKIVMNKAAVDVLYAGIADGLIGLGERIIEDARSLAPHDEEAAASRGVPMMRDTGFVTVWGPVEGKSRLLHGSAEVAASKNKPRGVRTPPGQVVMIAAFASPIAHLQELGTVKMQAHPFLTPAMMANVADAGPYVKGAMSRYAATAGARAERGAAIKQRKADARARAAVSPGLMAALDAEAAKR
jgi:hypothetical protein